jgi:N-acetylneuraminic acid mutarotase
MYIFILVAIACCHASRSDSLSWEILPNRGTIPDGTAGGVMGCVRDELVIFGGVQECTNLTGNAQFPCLNKFYGDTYIYNVESGTWRKPTTYGPVPGSRSFHRGVGHDQTESLYFYGGVKYAGVDGTQFETFGDFQKFNKRTSIYTALPSDPGVRIDPGLSILGNKIYLFGGLVSPAQFPNQTDQVMRNDVWVYDITTNLWNLAIPNNPGSTTQPEGRYQCRFDCNERNGKCILSEGDILPDNWKRVSSTWVLDVDSLTWTRLDDSSVQPLFTGISATYENKFYKMGGELRYGTQVQCRDPITQKKNNPVNTHYEIDFTQPDAAWREIHPTFNFPPLEQQSYCR